MKGQAAILSRIQLCSVLNLSAPAGCLSGGVKVLQGCNIYQHAEGITCIHMLVAGDLSKLPALIGPEDVYWPCLRRASKNDHSQTGVHTMLTMLMLDGMLLRAAILSDVFAAPA